MPGPLPDFSLVFCSRLCTLRTFLKHTLSGVPLIKILSPLATRGRGHLIRGGGCAHRRAFKLPQLASCSQSCWFRCGPEAGARGHKHSRAPVNTCDCKGGKAGWAQGKASVSVANRRGKHCHPTAGTIQKGSTCWAQDRPEVRSELEKSGGTPGFFFLDL